ncbi:MAG: DUF1674 domain-containing protein [Roseiarcus sp.]
MTSASDISPRDGSVEEAGPREPAAWRGEPGEAARRALAEAEQRRLKAAPPPPREVGGRGGPEPVRYGDWEVNGLASDF